MHEERDAEADEQDGDPELPAQMREFFREEMPAVERQVLGHRRKEKEEAEPTADSADDAAVEADADESVGEADIPDAGVVDEDS